MPQHADLALPEKEEVTTEWLSAALGRPGQLASHDAVEIGTGQVGSSVRYTLQWEGSDEESSGRPASVVGKFPAVDELSRRTGGETESYVREVGFYRDLQGRTPIRTPSIFHLDEDIDANKFVLLMEDLDGSVQGDQLDGCSVEAAQLAVAAAADLHGPHWGDTSLAGLSWIHWQDIERSKRRLDLYSMTVPGFVQRYADRLDGSVLELAPWLDQRLPALGAAFRLPPTLAHGDYRLDNMMFGEADGAPPLVVVDWQTCTFGSGLNDVAYFVGAGLLPDDRRPVEMELVSIYADALRGYKVEADTNDLENDYRLGSCAGYIMAVLASQIVVQTERGDEMFCAMAERHAAQMTDLEVHKLL